MDCREFGLLTKDFIFDEIKDEKIIKEYLEHAKQCRDCHDELEVTYSMHRSLGDVMGPDGKDDSADYIGELQEINDYYTDMFLIEKQIRIIKIICIIVILCAMISMLVRIGLEIFI